MYRHRYTPEQKRFIEQNVFGQGNVELTEIFNAQWGLELSVRQIKTFKKNYNLSSSLDGQFKPGHIPFNKGKKGLSLGGIETQFKKGNKPNNWVPIGTERVNGDGYVDIKITDGKLQKNWKGKHILIWEATNGPVPNGHAVIFTDRNRRNFDPDNLLLVSRKQLVKMNQQNLIKNNSELTKAGVIIADIYKKIGEKKRKHKLR